jgi:hypothetical protein
LTDNSLHAIEVKNQEGAKKMTLSKKVKKEILVSSTLLNFLRDKVGTYIPPEKENSAPGRPSVFGHQKYGASLYMLTSTSQKDIAKNLKVPYDLFRKWNTQPEFKKMVQENMDQFVDDYLRRLLREIESLPPDEYPLDFFKSMKAEFRVVNPLLHKKLIQKISGLKDERPDLILIFIAIVSDLLFRMHQAAGKNGMGRRLRKLDVKELDTFSKETIRSLLDFVGSRISSILDKPKLMDEDKEEVRRLVDVMKNYQQLRLDMN